MKDRSKKGLAAVEPLEQWQRRWKRWCPSFLSYYRRLRWRPPFLPNSLGHIQSTSSSPSICLSWILCFYIRLKVNIRNTKIYCSPFYFFWKLNFRSLVRNDLKEPNEPYSNNRVLGNVGLRVTTPPKPPCEGSFLPLFLPRFKTWEGGQEIPGKTSICFRHFHRNK